MLDAVMQSASMVWNRWRGSSNRGANGPGGTAPWARPRWARSTMSMSSTLTSVHMVRTVANASGSGASPGGTSQVHTSVVDPAPRGTSLITKAWLGRTDSNTLGNRARKRPLTASDSSRPAAAGSASQPSSSPDTGVVVWPMYMPGPW